MNEEIRNLNCSFDQYHEEVVTAGRLPVARLVG